MSGSQQVTADAEQVLDRAVDGREALELPCGLEAAHLPFALLRRFVRDLGSVVGVRVRAVDDRGHHRAADEDEEGTHVGSGVTNKGFVRWAAFGV